MTRLRFVVLVLALTLLGLFQWRDRGIRVLSPDEVPLWSGVLSPSIIDTATVPLTNGSPIRALAFTPWGDRQRQEPRVDPSAPITSHCWHAALWGTSTASHPPTHRQDYSCCWCGDSREITSWSERDPAHGPVGEAWVASSSVSRAPSREHCQAPRGQADAQGRGDGAGRTGARDARDRPDGRRGRGPRDAAQGARVAPLVVEEGQ